MLRGLRDLGKRRGYGSGKGRQKAKLFGFVTLLLYSIILEKRERKKFQTDRHKQIREADTDTNRMMAEHSFFMRMPEDDDSVSPT